MSNFCGNCGDRVFGTNFCNNCGNRINNNNNNFQKPTFPVLRQPQPQPTFMFGQPQPSFGFPTQPTIIVTNPRPQFGFGQQPPTFFMSGNVPNRPLNNGNHNSGRLNCTGGRSVHTNCVSCMKLGL